MAMAGYVLDMPTQMDYFRGLMAKENGVSVILETVRQYLANWSKERIADIQKIDAGWAPFDVSQRPLQINGALDVRCIRDAIHCHCMALREARVALPPDMVELDEFFFVACEMLESHRHMSLQARTPESPSHRDVFANW
jgi:hypothetical protein